MEPFGDEVYYFGDLHAHTGVSGDAACAESGTCTGECGSQTEIFDTAKANGLDFVAFPDHTNGDVMADSAEWEALAAEVMAANDPVAGFVTIPAAEIFLEDGTTKIGHRTLLFFGDDTRLSGLTMAEASPNGGESTEVTCSAVWGWLSALQSARGDVLAIPHHPAAQLPMATSWKCHNPAFQPAVEVYSGHGSSLGDGDGYDPLTFESPTGSVHAALDPARFSLQLGFVGGTDRHDTRPGDVCEVEQFRDHPYGGGLTAVVLDAGATFDRAAVHDAIVARRTYATSGPQVPVRVTWDVRGHEAGGMGDEIGLEPDFDPTVTVSVPNTFAAYVTDVVLVGPEGETSAAGDGAGNWTAGFGHADAPAWIYARLELDGEAYYGAGNCEDGGTAEERVWTSPTWFHRVEDADGDGVPALEGDCAPFDPAISPAATEVWYDGVDQDCAGDDDWDADGDAHDGRAAGGDDCDDHDAAVRPGAPDLAGDGVDSDCDGRDGEDEPSATLPEMELGGSLGLPDLGDRPGPPRDEEPSFERPEPSPNGCSTTGGMSGWWALTAGLLAGGMRRARDRRGGRRSGRAGEPALGVGWGDAEPRDDRPPGRPGSY
jgi:hypothetical protein